MAKRFHADGNKEVAVAGRKDRISALPEDVLQQLLSWLPSCDAVRTCALARGWRTRWKTVPSLRINDFRERLETYKSAEALSNFVKKLLRFRDEETPLDVCIINTHEDEESREDVEQWIRYAVSRKVRTLMIYAIRRELLISEEALISKHLTVLMLTSILFRGDFLGCQALEVLGMEDCMINLGSTFPESLRHLTIRNSLIFPVDDPEQPYISAPGLVTLEVSDCSDWPPWLDGLPSLVTAFIRIADNFDDCRIRHTPIYLGERDSESCEGCYRGDDCLLFLKALSGATNLELMSATYLIFGKDLKWYPVFSNLKTLLLNDWCVASYFNGLVYFLQNSPILEKPTLQVRFLQEESDTIMGELDYLRNQFFVSKHLKVVKTKCRKEDKWIHQILNVLSYHGVQSELITIKEKFRCSMRFSFEQY